jgi:hypothetical protein
MTDTGPEDLTPTGPEDLTPRRAIGSAGELIVQARLLIRRWTAGNVNTGGMMNAPAVDLLAAKGSRNIRIAVKTTGHGSQNIQWGVDEDWTTLFKGDVRPDFVVFVWFSDCKENPDICRIFVVPADVVDAAARESHLHWHKYPRRDGSPRKRSRHVSLTWTGSDTETNISRGFAAKWAEYEDAWHLLEN